MTAISYYINGKRFAASEIDSSNETYLLMLEGMALCCDATDEINRRSYWDSIGKYCKR